MPDTKLGIIEGLLGKQGRIFCLEAVACLTLVTHGNSFVPFLLTAPFLSFERVRGPGFETSGWEN